MFCSKCGTANDDVARFCGKCGNALALAGAGAAAATAGPPPPPPGGDTVRGGQMVARDKRYAAGKNPAVALILSLLVIGVGQFYNGDIKKGLAMLAGTVVLGLLTGGIAVLAFWIWSVYDAYQVAGGKLALW